MDKKAKKLLWGVGMCAVTAGCVLTFENRPIPVQPASSVPETQEQASSSVVESVMEKLDELSQNGESLTDDELKELLSAVLDPEEEPMAEEDASADSAPSSASAGSVSAGSSAPASSVSGSTASASLSGASAAASGSTGTHSTASSSQTQRDSCDEQIAQLIAQLYVQQDRYERELLEIIRQAHQEYVAYPESERNLVLKVQIVLGKTGALSDLEKECDTEVNSVCKQMETILKENGRDTAIVQEARKTYNQKKSDLKQELIRQTYSGGDGSGSAGHWLYDQLGE